MDAPTPITPAGWYDDGRGQLRWWDGERWTEHTAPLARPAAPAQPRSAYRPQGELKQVKRSKLVWILPVAIVAAGLIGGLLGAVAASSFSNTDPLKRTYADFLAAERSGDCVALQQVTTSSFRDDLTDDLGPRFSCALWRAHLADRDGSIDWALRVGPVGMLIAEERTKDGIAPVETVETATYTIVREGGRWRLSERDDGSYE